MHWQESRKRLAEKERRSNAVVREWLKKQRDVNKQKMRAARRRVAADQRFIDDVRRAASRLLERACLRAAPRWRTPGRGSSWACRYGLTLDTCACVCSASR